MAKDAESSLEDLTVAELRDRASELEITGRSSMNKDELATAVGDAQVQLSDSTGSTATFDRGNDERSSEKADDNVTVLKGDDIPSAPSIGPNTVIELEPPEVRLERGNASQVDAMGLDKRRTVVGGSYSPSLAKQATLYGIFVAVLLGLVIGGKILVDDLDAPPEVNEAKAPWAQADAAQTPPARLE